MEPSAVKRHLKGTTATIIVFGIVLNLMMLTVPVYMLQIYDRVLSSQSMPTLWALTAIAVAVLAFMAGLDACRSHLIARSALGLEVLLAPAVVKASLAHRMQHSVAGTGNPMREIEKVRNAVVSGAVTHLIDIPWFPIYLGIIYLFHPLLGVIATAGACILVSLAIGNELASRRTMRNASRRQDELADLSDGIYRCADVVWAMGQAPCLLRKWRLLHQAGAFDLLKALHQGGSLQAWSRSARQVMQLAVLCAGAGLAIDGEISAGVMVVASIILGRALAPIEQTIGNWRTLQAGWSAWRRLGRLVAGAPKSNEAVAFAVDGSTISVRNCNYVPPGSRLPTLKTTNLTISAGEVVAFIGPSGAGKSTLVRILTGILCPTTGSANIGGHAIARLAPEQAAGLIGYVPQNFEFVPGTIAASISGFETETVNDQVVAAARRVGLHDVIQELPEGYRTPLGGSMNPLSHGQMQRLALARALYREPTFLILDEPSSSLDHIGEEFVLSAIAELKAAGKSVVIVAHRPSILIHADRVVVLNNGVIEAEGSYAEILPHVSGGASPSSGGRKPASLLQKARL